MVEDLQFELLERGRGVDAQIVTEPGPVLFELCECFDLPAGSIEGRRANLGELLAVGILENQESGIGCDVRVAVGIETDKQPRLLGGQAKLVEPYRFGPHPVKVCQGTVRRPGPQAECLVVQL